MKFWFRDLIQIGFNKHDGVQANPSLNGDGDELERFWNSFSSPFNLLKFNPCHKTQNFRILLRHFVRLKKLIFEFRALTFCL
jgi:hypothetical protein